MSQPFDIIKQVRVTEKGQMLKDLKKRTSNPSLARFQGTKILFEVARDANKVQIKEAVEAIYADKQIKVMKVNTITGVRKKKRRRGLEGYTSAFKKAIVTLRESDVWE